jgi:antitoxin component of MazEF toxin-antitoxin module
MRPSFRKVRADKKGTFYLSIPKQFVKTMELSKGQKLKVDLVSKNKLEISKG